jgi:hypothetical protein
MHVMCACDSKIRMHLVESYGFRFDNGMDQLKYFVCTHGNKGGRVG